MERSVAASAWSGSPSLERTMIDLARCAPTLMRSCISMGLPVRKTTLVPCRSLVGSCSRSSVSMSSLPSGESTTMAPPPSLWFATQISSMSSTAFSVQPRISVWFFSTTRDRPCRRLSILLWMASTTTPMRAAKKMMPPTEIRLPTIRCCVEVTSEWVPGSAMNVHEFQRPSTKAFSRPSPGSFSCTAIQTRPPSRIWARPTMTRAAYCALRCDSQVSSL
mmetsp:Transcript_110540/g.356816  ORF Transcript_110540/g.356816 Transcript_110540/m.356816 type:complete len:220 (+) Transcript_110540:1613-2272(+)